MRTLKSLLSGSLFLAFAAAGCGDSNNSEDLSQLTPAELCQKKCDLEVAANCSNTPPEFGSDCVLICEAKYQKFPSCAATAHALDACAVQRVSYGCNSGSISAMPVGACAMQGAACASCTGSFLDCL